MPEITIDNSFLTERARDYAALSQLAYADWNYNKDKNEWVPSTYQDDWEELRDKGYRFIIQKKNDSATGYSGILFEAPADSNGITQRILVNRGTSPTDAPDRTAATQLLNGEMPSAQFCSMMKFIEELQINKNIMLNEFDVTGHSLGGTLAQMAKATWPEFVDAVYTFNAPGAKNLTQNYVKLRNSDKPGYVVVGYQTDPSSSLGWEEEWAVSTWNSYERYLAFRGSVDGSKVYNISGKDFISPVANLLTDIGSGVFTDGSLHSIASVRSNLQTSPFYVDARKDFTIIGSDRSEAFVGGYKRNNNDGDPVGKLTFVGGYGSDRLQGWNGDDTLYGDLPKELDGSKTITGNVAGRAGNDTLTGGQGDDRLFGGGGDDTYLFYLGDGNDTIKDSEGINTIIYKGNNDGDHVIGNFFRSNGQNIWSTADGKIQINQESNWRINLPGGGTITFEDFQASSFGIQLLDVPGKPQAGMALAGDLAPVDSDESEPGIQVAYDSWGNVITDPDKPARGRSDTLYDTTGNDRIKGLGGNDYILARQGGNDWLLGGDGNDFVISITATGEDILEGGSGSDLLAGGPGDDLVFAEDYGEMTALIEAGEIAPTSSGKGDLATGNAGNDFVYGSNRSDLLFGGKGHDLIVGGGGDDAIFGDDDFSTATAEWSFTITQGVSVTIQNLTYVTISEPGDDVIYAGSGNDFVYAGPGNDEIYGGDGDDTILGEAGDDFISGGAGDDYLEGDAIWVAASDQGNDYIDGGSGNDQIWGYGGADDLFGGEGNDIIQGGEGDDYIDGGPGDNILYGDAGDDTIFAGAGADRLEGGAGDDYLDGGAGENTLLGGDGNDTLIGGVDRDLLQGDAGDDYLDGGAGDDILAGAGGADILFGGDGNDSLHGDSADTLLADQGDDYIDGGTGNDILVGYGGNDELYGGDGNDALWGDGIAGAAGNDTLDGGTGSDSLYAGAGDDTLYGGDGDDALWGEDGNDLMDGGAGNDILYAGYGADTLYGGSGDDQLFGEAGDDTLDGGAGDDYLQGGMGSDTYVWGKGYGNDTIQSSGEYTEYGYMNGTDTLVFGQGLTLESFDFSIGDPNSSDLVIRIRETGETLTLVGWYALVTDKIDRFLFADGTELTAADIDAQGITLRGTEGNDILRADYGRTMTIYGLGGDDTLNGANMNDRLYGGDGNDKLFGGDGNDILSGDAGDDELRGGRGNDTYLFGKGSGNDVIFSDDTYYNGVDYTNGDDAVVLGKGLTRDAVEILAGGLYNQDLILKIKETGETLSFRQWGGGWWGQVDRIVFADGTVLTAAEIAASGVELTGTEGNDYLTGWFDYEMAIYGRGGDDTLYAFNKDSLLDGGAGNDTLYGSSANDQLLGGEGDDYIAGSSGDDIITGGPGDDVIIGGDGSDTYRYALGDGNDVIWREDADVLEFGPGITAASFELLGEGENDNRALVFRFTDTGETVRLMYPYDGDSYNDDTLKMQVIRFADGTEMTATDFTNWLVKSTGTDNPEFISGFDDVKNEIYALGGNDHLYGKGLNDTLDGGAGNDYLHGAAGNDILFGGAGDDYLYGDAGNDILLGGDGYDNLSGGAGDDILSGGPGTDILDGGAGADIYRFSKGDGNDYIFAGSEDILEFGAGITPASVEFTGSSDSGLIVRIKDTGEQVYINQWFTSDACKVGIMKFADGTELTAADIMNGPSVITGTEGADSLTGIANKVNTIYGLGGNDGLKGMERDDYLDGGAGNDTIRGWRGNDTLIGGPGNDKLYGESGSDIYIFGKGHGKDTLQDLNETPGSTDTVKLDGITKNEVIFSRNYSDLLVLTSKNDSIQCTNNLYSSVQYTSPQTGTFTDTSPGIDRVETSDGFYITRADIIKIVNAMVSYNISDRMSVSTQYTNFMNNTPYQTMMAQSWHQITNP